jgi:hypothetical protein
MHYALQAKLGATRLSVQAGAAMPAANRPAVPTRNFLMNASPISLLSIVIGLSARMSQLPARSLRPGSRSPRAKWQHSRKLVGPVISSPGFLGRLGSQPRQQSAPIHSQPLADATLLSPNSHRPRERAARPTLPSLRPPRLQYRARE